MAPVTLRIFRSGGGTSDDTCDAQRRRPFLFALVTLVLPALAVPERSVAEDPRWPSFTTSI